MKLYLEKAIFVNRAPFDKLELYFNENEIAVLSAVNGRGKTTILSHIVDAFYEMARPHFPGAFENKENKFYRLSSVLHNIDFANPSFVYLRFKNGEENIDYIDVRNSCTEVQYNEAITIDNKIPFSQLQQEFNSQNYLKKISSNFNADKAKELFSDNLLTYFPSYRYEQPGYLNDPYKVNLNFKKESEFTGYLRNQIEVTSDLPQLTNWIMDVILDNQYLNIKPEDLTESFKNIRFEEGMLKDNLPMLINAIIQINILQKSEIQKNLNDIITKTLISKNYGNLRFGVGRRGMGSTRVQVVNTESGKQVYPTIFNISAGESAILCLFGELLRQADNNRNDIHLSEIIGIVLIDEADKHLHIKLQKEILPELFKLFPNIQFIVSSHSPFLSMGLAEKLQERSKLIDIENGLSIQPLQDKLYQEVYEMMIDENKRYKKMYDSIISQIENEKELQIITEGNNSEHISKAISVLDNSLMDKIKIITGSKDRSGDRQLKNAYEIMVNATQSSKFLFVWDCDSASIVDTVIEKSSFKKFCFQRNEQNSKAKKGIENLYPDTLFTDDVYDEKKTEIEYGGIKNEKIFNKNKFLEKIRQENNVEVFNNFKLLIEKIKNILSDGLGSNL
jgi:predicted ATP-binding protein involved in virulence